MKDMSLFASGLYSLDVEEWFGCSPSQKLPIWELNVKLKKKDAETGIHKCAAMQGCRVLPDTGSGIYKDSGLDDQSCLAAWIGNETAELFESFSTWNKRVPYPKTGDFKAGVVNSKGCRPAYRTPGPYTTILSEGVVYENAAELKAFLQYFDSIIADVFPKSSSSKGLVTATLLWTRDKTAIDAFKAAGWNILPVHTPIFDAIMEAFGKANQHTSIEEIEPKEVRALVCACRVIDF